MAQRCRGTAFLGMLALCLLPRLVLMWNPGYLSDLVWYEIWGDIGATHGIDSIYDPGHYAAEQQDHVCDYPPVLPYLLTVLEGATRRVTGMMPLGRSPDVHPVKLLPILGDVVIVCLVFSLVRGWVGFWPALLSGASFAFNPAVIFNSAYWGQTDSVAFAFVLLSVFLLLRRHPELSGVALTIAAFTKPVGCIFGLMLALLVYRSCGLRRVWTTLFAAAGTATVILLPFALSGRLLPTLAGFLLQLSSFPLVSNNAHNLWGWVTFWRPVDARLLIAGLLPLWVLSVVAFLGVYACILARLWDHHGPIDILLAAAMLTFCFFMVSVHQHENHLFGVLPFLATIWIFERGLAVFFGVVSCTLLANMSLHDPYILSVALSSPNEVRMAVAFLFGIFLMRRTLPVPSWVWLGLVATNTLANTVLLVWVGRRYLFGRAWTDLSVSHTWLDLREAGGKRLAIAVVIGTLAITGLLAFVVNAAARDFWARSPDLV